MPRPVLDYLFVPAFWAASQRVIRADFACFKVLRTITVLYFVITYADIISAYIERLFYIYMIHILLKMVSYFTATIYVCTYINNVCNNLIDSHVGTLHVVLGVEDNIVRPLNFSTSTFFTRRLVLIWHRLSAEASHNFNSIIPVSSQTSFRLHSKPLGPCPPLVSDACK